MSIPKTSFFIVIRHCWTQALNFKALHCCRLFQKRYDFISRPRAECYFLCQALTALITYMMLVSSYRYTCPWARVYLCIIITEHTTHFWYILNESLAGKWFRSPLITSLHIQTEHKIIERLASSIVNMNSTLRLRKM